MIKAIKNNKGMTMIELIIAMMIFTIIALSVILVLVPTLKTYRFSNDLAEINTLMDNIATEVSGEFNRATNVIFNQNAVTIITAVGVVKYEVKNLSGKSMLYRNDTLFLDEGYYKDTSLKLEFFGVDTAGTKTAIAPANGASSFYMTVTLLKENQEIFSSRDYAIVPLGI